MGWLSFSYSSTTAHVTMTTRRSLVSVAIKRQDYRQSLLFMYQAWDASRAALYKYRDCLASMTNKADLRGKELLAAAALLKTSGYAAITYNNARKDLLQKFKRIFKALHTIRRAVRGRRDRMRFKRHYAMCLATRQRLRASFHLGKRQPPTHNAGKAKRMRTLVRL